ncbi:MAG: DUF5763 domain-containing protein [bacterium]|jgi:hypothetical protein|nr:DUF5763 domain-containing protein [bacterium]
MLSQGRRTTRPRRAREVLARLVLFALLALPVPARAGLLAVIDRSHPTSAELNADQLSLLAQAVRGEAARHLGAREVAVLSEENTVTILKDMGVDLARCEGECEVELARTLQADWLVTSKVVRFGAQWTLQLNLFKTATGQLAGSEQLTAKGKEDLVNGVPRAACRLLAGTWAPDSACASLAQPAAPGQQSAGTPARPAVVRTADSAPSTPSPAAVQPPKNTPGRSTRCLGTTQAGARCKRTTERPSGYCWQHEDQAGTRPWTEPAPDLPDAERCRAMTQRGTRCTRRATANGLCWQHKK